MQVYKPNIPIIVTLHLIIIFIFFFALDIDECSEKSDSCDHKCVNTIGSYQCSCQSGFTLDNKDGFTCNGNVF